MFVVYRRRSQSASDSFDLVGLHDRAVAPEAQELLLFRS